MAPNTIFSDLRPEAHPIEWDKLFDGQKKAIEEMITILYQALGLLEDFEKNNKTSECSALITKNVNRTAFLSGGRGSGKTSILYTLKMLLSSSCYENISKNLNEKTKCRLEYISNRIIWLSPLQMETLPNKSNLLAAILSRINAAVDTTRTTNTGCEGYNEYNFDLNPKAQKALSEFEHLQRNVAMAWDGNLEKHAPRMDPDAYAVEVLRTERNRFQLEKQFLKALSKLNKYFLRRECDKPLLFLLPIDDFDLNPQSSVHLAKLIQLASVPYLFTIIQGDIAIARNVFDLNIKRSLSNTTPESSPHHIPLNNRIAHDNSANAIRKLFPLSHIVKLHPMRWEEVLEFKPEEDKETVEELLGQVNVEINTRNPKDNEKQYVAGIKIQTLKDFMTIEVNDLVINDADDDDDNNNNNNNNNETNDSESGELRRKDMVYLAPFFFKLYPRHAQDLWRYLKQNVGNMEKNETEEQTTEPDDQKSATGKQNIEAGKKFALDCFRLTAQETRDLSLELSHELLNSVGRDCSGDIQLKTEHMKLESLSGPGIHLYDKNYNTESTIELRLPKDWICKVNIEHHMENTPDHWVELSDGTSAAMMLLHDLITLSKPKGTIGPSLMKKLRGPCWAQTRWPVGNAEGIDVLWHTPPWQSMWAHDFMRRCWIEFWHWLYDWKQKENKSDNVTELAAYYWIKIGTGVFDDTSISLNKVNRIRDLKKLRKLHESKKLNKNELTKLDKLEESEKTNLQEIACELEKIKNSIKKDTLNNRLIEAIKSLGDSLEKKLNAGDSNTIDTILNNLKPFGLMPLPSKGKKNNFIPFIQEGKKNDEIDMVESWEWLISAITAIVNKYNGNTMGGPNNKLFKGWMARICCLLAPESGLPENIAEKFANILERNHQKNQDTYVIKEFWKEPDIAHEIRRLRTQSAVQFFEHGALEKLYELYRPTCRETNHYIMYYRSDSDFITLANNIKNNKHNEDKHTINDIDKSRVLCPYIEDIVASSQLDRDKKKQYEKVLVAMYAINDAPSHLQPSTSGDK